MKIGIMTFWWSEDNYGQILQCYALQKYLRDAGHDAYLIRYDPKNDFVKTPFWKKVVKGLNPVRLYNYLKYKRKKSIDKKEKTEHSRKFQEFRDAYLKQSEKIYYSYHELFQNPPNADVYIVGSDQVWNPGCYASGSTLERVNSQLNAYFLNFGNRETKRIAYAVSFGKEKITDELKQKIIPLLKQFDYISVREKSGSAICRQCGVENAEWVPDPTMLLDAEQYHSLYENTRINYDKPYCLLYMLGNKYDFSIQNIFDWAEKRLLNVIYITGNSQLDAYKKTYATIPEWLYLIDHAEYVITNSYHCSVFSLLFQKKLGIILLTGKDSGMNSRFESLFEQFQIEKRFIIDTFDGLETDSNWNIVNDIFNRMQTFCKLNDVIYKENKCL
jgi:hypothetical protein